jgi:hypothetical protein
VIEADYILLERPETQTYAAEAALHSLDSMESQIQPMYRNCHEALQMTLHSLEPDNDCKAIGRDMVL